MDLESYVLDAMEGRTPGKSVLRALSYLYRAGVFFRNLAYDKNWIGSDRVDATVISIGNIVAGGTGKTPLVRLLAEEISKERKVAILSRGYRSEIERSNHVACISPHDSVEKCGDEPFWLASKLPQVPVWVGKNRLLSAFFASASGSKVLILDDGMQYRKLHRDIEIVVMDGEDLFGKGYFLPRGLLRDAPARLKNADLIMINQAKNQERTVQEIAKYTAAPLVFMRMKLDADLKGKRIGLFCAIGKPDKFMEGVRHCGAEIIATFFKRDHDRFTTEELEAFAKRSKADLLVCTEKDQVKLPSDLHLPILALEGELEIVSGKEHWDNIYERRIQNHTS